jgi:hypothetical protein
MYQWVVFIHVASILLFMLAHGVHVTAMWAFRREPEPETALTFFNDLPKTTTLRILLALVVLSGVIAGFMGGWWGDAWIWTSLVLLVGIALSMWRFGGGYFGLVQGAAEAAIAARSGGGDSAAAQAAYDEARGSWQVMAMSAVGLGGIAVILWLMMFKPF